MNTADSPHPQVPNHESKTVQVFVGEKSPRLSGPAHSMRCLRVICTSEDPQHPQLTWFLMAFCSSSWPLLIGTCQEGRSNEACL